MVNLVRHVPPCEGGSCHRQVSTKRGKEKLDSGNRQRKLRQSWARGDAILDQEGTTIRRSPTRDTPVLHYTCHYVSNVCLKCIVAQCVPGAVPHVVALTIVPLMKSS